MPSPLDRELERAVADDEKTPVGMSRRTQPARRKPKGNLTLLAVLLTMMGGIVALIMTSFKDAAVYAKTVDRLVAEQTQLAGRRVRVEGNLVHGTLERRDTPCEYRFSIERGGATIKVRYAHCSVPDTFRDVPGMDVGVTAEGKLGEGGEFVATDVLAKCPSKYEMKQRKANGEQMPHAQIGDPAQTTEATPNGTY